MVKEWQTFVRKFDDMKEGEMGIFIKDLTPGPNKYNTRHVRARIASSKNRLSHGDLLWIRSESGIKAPEPWFIELIDDLPEWVQGRPWENVLDMIAKTNKNGTILR
jgi:hypothetical protein